jgi:spore coat polysaccharide biosynthesis protein SpsF
MICIVQARMSSKRLPGKTLLKIKGKSVLERVVLNLNLSKKIKKIIVATSSRNSDKEIINFCKKNSILYTTGPLENVALRFIRTLKRFPCNVFLRISADSPLINYKIIDKMINLSKNKKFDIFTNTFPRSFPKGFSVEIINTITFKKNYKKFNKFQKEHITTFFYQRFKMFKIINFKSKKNLSNLNFSVDTKSDLINVSRYI